MFDELHAEFEARNTNLHLFQQRIGFSKYILIRSLDTQALRSIILNKTGNNAQSSIQDDLYRELFETNITTDELIEYIRQEYPRVREQRLEQEEYLPEIIENFGVVRCGIRNDNMNDVAKALVRDKSIRSKEELDRKIEDLLQGTIKGYIEWQYYNQVTNDLIEHIFNNHTNVIPTIRKIHDVDFFVKIDNMIVPFDLKITHISNDFFDLYSKGIVSNEEQLDGYDCIENDDYCINRSGSGEMDQIKNLYKEIKETRLPKMTGQTLENMRQNLSNLNIPAVNNQLDRLESLGDIKELYRRVKAEYDLPNMSVINRQEMLEIAGENNQTATEELMHRLVATRQECLNLLKNDRNMLEWWNYKFQGERLFKNNNRFFVFLAYRDSFEDARPLKGNVEELEEIINIRLDEINDPNKINTINYFYSKDRNLRGQYRIQSTSVIYVV